MYEVERYEKLFEHNRKIVRSKQNFLILEKMSVIYTLEFLKTFLFETRTSKPIIKNKWQRTYFYILFTFL